MESIAVLHIIVSVIVLLLLLWGCNQLSRKLRPQCAYQAKVTTYESGAAPIGHARTALKNPIYVLGLIFLLFEIETILLFPWALVYTQSPTSDPSWYLHMGVIGTIFILVLGIGWVYVMRNWERIMCDHVPTLPTDITPTIPVKYYDRINAQYAGNIALPHSSTSLHATSISE